MYVELDEAIGTALAGTEDAADGSDAVLTGTAVVPEAFNSRSRPTVKSNVEPIEPV